ncbi:MAG: hypothetical protein ACFFDN_00815 [Candidatus Hodarchaeota archaeon]
MLHEFLYGIMIAIILPYIILATLGTFLGIAIIWECVAKLYEKYPIIVGTLLFFLLSLLLLPFV